MPDEAIGTPRARLRKLNLVLFLPWIVGGGALGIVLGSNTWRDVLVLSIGLVVTTMAFVLWVWGDLLRVAVPYLLVAAGVWVYGVLVPGTGSAFYAILLVGSLVVPELPRRGIAAAVLVAFVPAVGALRFLVDPAEPMQTLVVFVMIPAVLTAIVVAFMFPNKSFYDLVHELEDSRDREAELAVARERIRFAGDLHDIQGHTLHVAKLKIALAQKLLRTDVDRVEAELAEVYALIGDTIGQTKELVYAQRRLNLSVELENARNLFEAAGIKVRVVRESAEVDAASGEMLGQVLRETTTNILRHAQATSVRITLGASNLTVVNDGARDEPTELKGLAALRDRIVDQGGTLTADRQDGTFRTTATLVSNGVAP